MSDFYLRKKLKELCSAQCTLLWLEGARYERVTSVKLMGNRLVLQLSNETTRVVLFERYAPTEVGLQFWSKGRPGVLYRWDQVPQKSPNPQDIQSVTPTDEPPSPPDIAA